MITKINETPKYRTVTIQLDDGDVEKLLLMSRFNISIPALFSVSRCSKLQKNTRFSEEEMKQLLDRIREALEEDNANSK